MSTIDLELFDEDTAATSVLDVAAAPDGGWVTLNAGGSPVTVYDGQTRAPVRWLGQRGSGPGDFTGPSNFAAPATDGVAHVWDASRRIIVDQDLLGGPATDSLPPSLPPGGHFVSSLRRLSPGSPERLIRAGSGVVYQHQIGVAARPGDLRRMRLIFVGRDGSTTPIYDGESALDTAAATELVEVPLWASCGGESVVYYDPEHSTISWWSPQVPDAVHVSLNLQPEPLTLATARAYVRAVAVEELSSRGHALPSDAELDRMIEPRVSEVREMMPDSLPAISAMLCDSNRRVYVNRFDPERLPLGIGHRWIRISPQGEREEIALPAGFVPVVAVRGAMAGVYTDSTGLQRLAVIRLAD